MKLVCPECGEDSFTRRFVRLISETFTVERHSSGYPIECSTGEEEVISSEDENDGMLTCHECSFELTAYELITEEAFNENDECQCDVSEPDSFGNRDKIVNPDCLFCA